jgi:hypothetical protein
MSTIGKCILLSGNSANNAKGIGSMIPMDFADTERGGANIETGEWTGVKHRL